MKFALILSGCGQHDGSETHETVLTLLSLAEEKVAWDAFAPEMLQHSVINHISEEPMHDERSVLVESARLVRGKISPLNSIEVDQYDAVIIPGGFGAVSNLCSWGINGIDFTFNQEVEEFFRKAKSLGKPMGFICIAPMMIPKLFADARLTVGNDQHLADQISSMGSNHIDCLATDVVVDQKYKIVSTPANMVAKGIDEVYVGIRKLVCELVSMC